MDTHIDFGFQVVRRALFLSKVLAPPSPTATTLPKTPPESPAIFHYVCPKLFAYFSSLTVIFFIDSSIPRTYVSLGSVRILEL